MSPDPAAPVRSWFESLQACVQRVDYASARPLFADDVVSFGTRASLVSGRGALEQQQWRGIWPNIRDFRFLLDQLHCDQDGDLVWAVVPWTSTGFDEAGTAYDRPGRATVIFRQQAGALRAVHTHFSISPGTPGRTFGPKN